MFEFQGARALITGSSSGIGAEFARQLHSLGTDVILVARRADRLNQLAAELNQKRANSTSIIVANLSDLNDLNEVAQFIRENQIDLLVNNAGRGSFGHYEDLALDEEQEMVALNVTATLTLAHAVIPQLKERRCGGIIAVSSIAAFQPLPYMATYAATKAFNFVHTHGLRGELLLFGLNLLTVCPGPTATEFGGVARVPGEMTNLRRDRVVDVVAEAIDGFRRGRATVIPGWRAKGIALVSSFLPSSLTAAITERILRGSLRKS